MLPERNVRISGVVGEENGLVFRKSRETRKREGPSEVGGVHRFEPLWPGPASQPESVYPLSERGDIFDVGKRLAPVLGSLGAPRGKSVSDDYGGPGSRSWRLVAPLAQTKTKKL